MTIVSDTGSDIWDVALRQYGGAEGVAWLLEDNPGLVDSNGLLPEGRAGFEIRPGQQRAFEEKISAAAQARQNPPRYRSNSQQTLWDVALQYYGDANGVAWLLEDNPGLIEIDGLVKEGRVSHRIRKSRANLPIWGQMVDYVPATGLEPTKRKAEVLMDDEGNVLMDDEGNVLGILTFQ